MMSNLHSHFWALAIFWMLSLSFLSIGCEESFHHDPPFQMVSDTVRLDVDDWFYIHPEAELKSGVHAFPFSYKLFGESFDGFLTSTDKKIFTFDETQSIKDQATLLNLEALPGDTIFKFSPFHYHLLIDRKELDDPNEELFYLLRRTRIGMKSKRERSVWVISPQFGLVGLAKYAINPYSGQVTLDIKGNPRYFADPVLVERIKFFDHQVTWYVDNDRSIIYEFDKLKGTIKSRDFMAGQNLDTYQFAKGSTQDLVKFTISPFGKDQILLSTEDSCYYFKRDLELAQVELCQ
ncbi:hypothetical protein [Pontibacter sp. G13]|uniref:hypothetical protein n=1 Tax=Pontibacter sp. G13 TaxID=3074898 RepID=UPI00288BDF5E|nr:hypothetical protein [Pontibacter sp. G13]WNJ16072.1 hypothetical protein RJD25_14510 [Pontibacter sp. G13]